MSAAQLRLAIGLSPATPAAGKLSVFAKGDKKLYTKDDAGVETLLVGQPTPLAAVDGTTLAPTVILQNAGIAGIIRTPAGDPAGDYTVTLAVATSVLLPNCRLMGGSARTIRAEFASLPYSVIRVRTTDLADVATDANFIVGFDSLT